MFQMQIVIVLLSIFLIYFLLSGFSLYSFINKTCYRTGNHHLPSKQSLCDHTPSYCGNTSAINLKCPFVFKGDYPDFCNEFPSYFELSCDKHNQTVLFLDSDGINNQYFYVELDSIDYGKQTMRVIDPGLQKNNCFTLPLYSFSYSYYWEHQIGKNTYEIQEMYIHQDVDALIFVSCKNPVRSQSPLYVDTTTCNITEKHFSKVKAPSNYSYVIVGQNLVAADIEESCTICKVVPIELQCLRNITGGDISFGDIHNLLVNGFKMTWSYDQSRSYPWSRRRTFFCKCSGFSQVFTGSSITELDWMYHL